MPVPGRQVEITLGQAVALSKSHAISKLEVDAESGTMMMTAVVGDTPLKIPDARGQLVEITKDTELRANIASLSVADLQQLGFVLPENYSTNAISSGLVGMLLTFLPLLFLLMILLFVFGSRGGAQDKALGFVRSRARLVSPDRPRLTFADVAGSEEAKQDLLEVVEFLKNRWKFQAIGATIPKGILLVGPPGTGKTLLARAVAGEAGVPFFSVSGSEFVELFVGVGAARVRDMFAQAKRNAPCIIFIDEIDAVGRSRSGGMPGGHEEREQTLNQILVEMDGFDPNVGVVVLAATNRPDVLDPALLRPGRFDRRVALDLPDTGGRLAILQLHGKGKVIDKDIDLAVIAKETHGFSGADLSNLMNEAAILTVRRDKKAIGMKELEEAIDRVIAGPERKSLRVNPKDKETTAYHEAGHALVARMLPNVDPVHKISIVARGSMGGYTRLLTEDRYFLTASKFRGTLATLLAGHASEEMAFNEVSTGPHSDIKQATALARKMITEFGMSKKLGLRTYGAEPVPVGMERKDYSDYTARMIDDEVKEILEEAHETARKILRENRARLAHIANRLLAQETLEGPGLEAAFDEPIDESPAAAAAFSEREVSGKPLTVPTNRDGHREE
ncbi:MAG: ATP-dependent zinc metalloprotease FtsH [Chloroflexi bacterium]|nr:ATP-dependent zinc metalloprotease FtsH [Chloroflexota bacterium]